MSAAAAVSRGRLCRGRLLSFAYVFISPGDASFRTSRIACTFALGGWAVIKCKLGIAFEVTFDTTSSTMQQTPPTWPQ